MAGATSHPACVFHTGGVDAGDGGAGGAAPVPTVTSQKNAFVGNYLADGAGKALYVYGADAAGDCDNPPISNCSADCAVSWPPFNGEPRVLGAGLDPALFGEILRGDGLTQTTYRGWPLYYYKNDLAAGDVKGQAVGKIWHLASLVLPNVVILRVGTIRSLGDGEGHALYASAADTVGSAVAPPVSTCSGACLQANPAFQPAYASPVSYLNAGDFSFFVRSDGGVQLAYKGAPLYRSLLDTRSGTLNGVVNGWSSVTP
jgi:predicted lipoprotein with Yx(FWY)xxD motif